MTRLERSTQRRFTDWNFALFLQRSLTFRKVKGVDPQVATIAIRERHSCGITLHHSSNTCRHGPKEVAEIQIGDYLIGDLEEQLKAVALGVKFGVLPLQLLLRPLRRLEAERGVQGQPHLVGNERKETDLLAPIRVQVFAAYPQTPEAPLSSRQGK